MKYFSEKVSRAESWFIAMLLAVVGGYLDIYCYLARGKVFANTQTGNLVLLGSNIATGNGSKVIYYLLAICAFAVGVMGGKFIEYKFKARKYMSWLHVILIIEIVALFLVMFIPEGNYNIFANMTVSCVCGLQVQAFRKVRGKAYSTVMFTGNLKNLVDQFTHFLITKDVEALSGSVIYLGVIVAFIIGGWGGTIITNIYHTKSVGFITIVLGIVFLALYLENIEK